MGGIQLIRSYPWKTTVFILPVYVFRGEKSPKYPPEDAGLIQVH